MMKLSRAFYIPVESDTLTDLKKVVREGIQAEVYTFINSRGKPAAKCFGGRRSKPDTYYYYSSIERRDQAIEDHFSKCEARENYRKSGREDRKTADRGLIVGDFIYDSWGYDQTNINFYKVVGLKGSKSVLIVAVGSILDSSNPPCDKVIPSNTVSDYDTLLGNDYKGDPVPKLAKNGSVRLCDGHHATKWGGDPLYETSSGWGH